MKFVGGKREQIDLGVFQIYRDLADRVNTVNMKQRVRPLFYKLADLTDRKNNAGFVVSKHYRHESCSFAKRRSKRVYIKFTLFIDIDPVDLIAVGFQVLTDFAYSFVL